MVEDFNQSDEVFEKTFRNKQSNKDDIKQALSEREDEFLAEKSGEKESGQGGENELKDVVGGGTKKNWQSTLGQLKKARKSPAIFIVSVLMLVITTVMGGMLSFPFAFVARTVNEFNSLSYSVARRTPVLRPKMLKTGVVEIDQTNWTKYRYPVKDGLFGKKFGITKKQQKSLAEQGIYFNKKEKVIEFDDGSGQLKRIKPDEFNDFFANNSAFRNGYLHGSKRWRGHFFGWFDNMILKVTARLGVDLRSKFKHFQQAEDIEKGNEKFKEMAKKRINTSATAEGYEDEERVRVNEEGEEVTEIEKNRRTHEVKVDNEGDVETAKANIDTHLKSISAASQASTAICTAMTVINSIQAIVMANQAIEMINLTAGFLEAIDKVKAGEGDKSPINNYMQMMTKPDKNGRSALQSYGIGSIFGMGGSGKHVERENESVLMSNREGLMASASVAKNLKRPMLMSDVKKCAYAKIAASGAGVFIDIVTLGGASGVKAAVKLAVGTAKGLAVKLLAAVLVPTAIEKIIEISARIMTNNFITKTNYFGEEGGDALASGAHRYLSENAKSGGQSPGSEAKVLAYQREVVAKVREENIRLARETLSPFDVSSEYTFLGSIVYNVAPVSLQLSSGIGTLNTFSGVVGRSIARILPSANALADTHLIKAQGYCPALESIGVMGDAYCNPYYITDISTIKYDPADVFEEVYRLGKAQTMGNEKGRLAVVELDAPAKGGSSLSCVGDALMGQNPLKYYYKYSSNFKIKKDPEPEISKKEGDDECTLQIEENEEGNPVINPHSRLGGYIRFCGQRGSNLGVADGNIASWVKYTDFTNGKFSGSDQSILNSKLLGLVPVVGDLLDAVDAALEKDNIPWIGGGVCVASEENPNWESEFKHYQRYIEDQRWMENVGMIEKSAIDSVVEQQLAWQPLDQSYEGVLARYAGMTKPQVVAMMDLMSYYSEVAEYQPTKRWQFDRQESNLRDFEAIWQKNAEKRGILWKNEGKIAIKSEKPLTKRLRYAIMEG